MTYSNSSRALAFLTETSEDAIAALKGIIGGAGSAKYLDTSEDKISLITTQIDSSRDEDRINGLTRIVAMISKGRDASSFLPGVLKLTSCSNMDVRKLVYIILLRYGNSNPDLTLLSINSFQRDLSDPSPLIRAMALRVLSAIKVKMVAGIVFMAVAKATRDPNLYVRKIAALAIPKCYQLDKTQLNVLLESLSMLLSDRSPLVLGAAISAFHELCPERWDLLHPHYRKICHALSDIDEWSQVTCLHVLSRYARANFTEPQVVSKPEEEQKEKEAPAKEVDEKKTKGKDAALDSFLDNDDLQQQQQSLAVTPPSNGTSMDRDLEILLAKTEPLLHSRNPAVVMASVRIIYYLAPGSRHLIIARPLIKLLRSPPETVYLILLNALFIARTSPHIFSPYATSFFLGASHSEAIHISLLKLDMLTTICNETNIPLIIPEVVTAVRSPSDQITTHAVTCLGKLPDQQRCLAALLDLLKHKKKTRDAVIAKAVLVIKDLIHSTNPNQLTQIIIRLSGLLFGTPPKTTEKRKKPKVVGKNAILHPEARASILWLLGQHCRHPIQSQKTLAELILPDILRRCAVTFTNESSLVKLQILTVSTKVIAFLPTVLGKHQTELVKVMSRLHLYLLKMARYDMDFDVRDRARLCKGLTPVAEKDRLVEQEVLDALKEVGEWGEEDIVLKGVRLRREQVLLVLFEGKEMGSSMLEEKEESRLLGTLSLALEGKLVRGFTTSNLPEWTEIPTPSEVREPPPLANIQPNTKSLSNNDFSTSSPVVPSPTPPIQQNGKNTDLDAFLDESSEEEMQLDAQAPEDDEFSTSEEEESSSEEEDESE